MVSILNVHACVRLSSYVSEREGNPHPPVYMPPFQRQQLLVVQLEKKARIFYTDNSNKGSDYPKIHAVKRQTNANEMIML